MKRYRSFSYSTRGASHKKNNLVCQDASLDNEKDNDVRMSIAIVADGHGSPQYFRSDIGSQKATEVALRGIREFIAQNPTEPESFADESGEKLLKGLAKNIIATWFNEVEEDEKNYPLKDDARLNLIEDKYRNRYLNDPDHQYFHHAYGTTLIAVVVTENYWFGLHIGDGKCVVLFDDGNLEQPIPWDDKCFLNSTTSLCNDDAISEFRFWYGPTSKDSRRPIALFVGSDGVDDTYPVYDNEKHLRHLYRSVVLSFAENGFENTLPQIDELVQKLAEHGSQDDVSIAGIISDVTPFVELLTAQDEVEKADDRVAEEHKKAEEKKQAERAARAKAEQEKKHEHEIQKKTIAAEQKYNTVQKALNYLLTEHRKQKNNIEEARKTSKADFAELNKTRNELRGAEAESRKHQEALRIAEAERKAAEAQVLQQEEQRRLCKERLQAVKKKFEQTVVSPNSLSEFPQVEQEASPVVHTPATGSAESEPELDSKQPIQDAAPDELLL